MAIDPSIILGLKTPAVPDPLVDVGKALQVRNQLQAGQQSAAESAQSLQEGSMKIQQSQQDLKDQQILGDALKAGGGDPNATLMNALKDPRGFSGKAAQALMQQNLKNRETQATAAKDQADADKANQETQTQRSQAIFDTTGALLQMKPEDRAAAFPAARQRMLDQGHIDPASVPEDYATYGGDSALMQHHLQFGTQVATAAETAAALKQKADLAEEARKAALAPSQLTSAQNAAVTSAPVALPAGGSGTAAQAQEARDRAATLTQTTAHNLSEESTAKLNAATNAGRLLQERTINGMKYGPGTQEYWVQQLQDNPDSVKDMPPELRTSVGQLLKAKTGLPLPTPADAASQAQEIAARDALDGITFIQQAIQNPEIRAQLGPVMGRLGNAEQSVGTAVGLSPQAEQLAQELRTRMRYFVFQESKAVLGGRLPQQLVEQLESSSASPKMDFDMLAGALKGAGDNARDVLTNVDRLRFGGQARPPEMRGAAATATPASGDMINAQIPGQPAGKIHRSQRDAFLKQYPNAIVDK